MRHLRVGVPAVPVRPLYKTYPVYHPSQEPPGYFDRLKRLEPQIVPLAFSTFKSQTDWIEATKLTLAVGFQPPSEDLKRLDIMPLPVGTDPDFALKTRRATGYYKVPSLKGVWYRGPFEHSSSVATLEDRFDRRRLRDDYVPKRWRPLGVKTRSVKGHEFGLELSSADKAALLAFLKTL